MSPFLKLLLLVVVAAAVWVVVSRVRAAQREPVAFTPVEELPEPARRAVDTALSRGDVATALRTYREATGSTLPAARAAIDVRTWKQGG